MLVWQAESYCFHCNIRAGANLFKIAEIMATPQSLTDLDGIGNAVNVENAKLKVIAIERVFDRGKLLGIGLDPENAHRPETAPSVQQIAELHQNLRDSRRVIRTPHSAAHPLHRNAKLSAYTKTQRANRQHVFQSLVQISKCAMLRARKHVRK